MKSSKYIKPAVGMVLRYHTDTRTGTVTNVIGPSAFRGTGNYGSDGFAWDKGAYEIIWIPPTDEERFALNECVRTFHDGGCGRCGSNADLIHYIRESLGVVHDSYDWQKCTGCNEAMHVIESLAMDGM